jgi:hypothetical protein
MRPTLFFAATLAFLSCTAQAGPYGDDLAKCLVSSTSKEDRESLIRWMFAASAANPAVAPIAKVSPEVMEHANVTTGKLFMRLLTESCKAQAKQALTYEGTSTIQLSFQVLGQVAGREMFADPAVGKAMAGMESSIDKKKLEELTGKQ